MENKVEVVCGGLKVISSGTILIRSDDETNLYLGDGPDGIRIEFLFNQTDSFERTVRTLSISHKHMQVKATNLNDTFAGFNNKPLHVANINGQKIYVTIATYVIGSMKEQYMRILHYSLGYSSL